MNAEPKFQKVYSSVQEVVDYLQKFTASHPKECVADELEKIRQLKILLVGETILDEYNYGRVIGKSGKEPVLVLKRINVETYAGGILNMANHLADFSNRVDVFTMLGENNSHLDFIKNSLDKRVHLECFYKKNSPTIIKRRFVEIAPIKKIFEEYVINEENLCQEQSDEVSNDLKKILPDYDLVICTDYGHEMMDRQIRGVLTGNAHFLAVNTQANAGNWGYHTISCYPKADYITLAEPELRLETRKKPGTSDLEQMIGEVAEKLQCKKIMITRSKEGCLGYDGHKFFKCPAFVDKSVDTMGAGDAFLAFTAPLAKNNAPMEVIGFLGNAAGALAVNIMGNKNSITKKDLCEFINHILT